jgi:hypothetical protein
MTIASKLGEQAWRARPCRWLVIAKVAKSATIRGADGAFGLRDGVLSGGLSSVKDAADKNNFEYMLMPVNVRRPKVGRTLVPRVVALVVAWPWRRFRIRQVSGSA